MAVAEVAADHLTILSSMRSNLNRAMQITSIETANIAIMTAYAGEVSNLEPELAQSLTGLLATPIAAKRISQFVEVVYARQDEVSEVTKLAAADVCDFASIVGMFGLGQNERGLKISQILRGQTVADAPVPVAAYAAQEDEHEIEIPDEPEI